MLYSNFDVLASNVGGGGGGAKMGLMHILLKCKHFRIINNTFKDIPQNSGWCIHETVELKQ